MNWMLEYADRTQQSYASQWNERHSKTEVWEKEMIDDFEARRGERHKDDAIISIFNRQNDSLNIIATVAGFITAQAKNDIFGTKCFRSIDELLATFGTEEDLSNAIAIAQVDKNAPSMVAVGIDPTTERDGFIDVFRT